MTRELTSAQEPQTASTVITPQIPDLERLIHERTRLAILYALAVNPSLTFVELKGILGTTEGNLSLHMRKLEDAKYVSISKSFAGRRPRTEFTLTAEGRRAFERYLGQMERLIRTSRSHRN